MPYRTDLAAEAEILTGQQLPAGIRQETMEAGSLRIHRVGVEAGEAERIIGKPAGEYITVTTPPFSGAAEVTEEEIAAIGRELASLLPEEGLVLVVGLGNNDITPDAIGPRTIRQVLATRHIGAELAGQSGLEGLRPAAALAPGVLGQTGMETSEVIAAVVKEVKPAAVVVVDALAARSASRLGCTIQLASSGISPGSGVMNARKELSEATLGVPVVSVGVPTVVDASTLLFDLMGEDAAAREPSGMPMMVTPREIDVLIGHACKTLSLAINKALQPSMTLEELGYLVS